MKLTTRIAQRSLDRDTWLQPIGEPEIVEHADMVAAMQYLSDEIDRGRPGNWTYHIFDARGARYSLHAAYVDVFNVAPVSTPRGYRYPRINR